jgi:hypothetical protein
MPKASQKKQKGRSSGNHKSTRHSSVERKPAGRSGAPAGARPARGNAAESRDASSSGSRRSFGLRGAAPWVARHAAKHAEELRRRNAEPPPPGSARATLRVPVEAEQIKTKVASLHQLITRIRHMRKRLDKSFFEIGQVLSDIQRRDLHIAKGYSTFESFLDREIELPRSVSLRLIRIANTFLRDSAYDYGLDRLTAALAALDGELTTAPPSYPSSRGWSSPALPPKPPLRFNE